MTGIPDEAAARFYEEREQAARDLFDETLASAQETLAKVREMWPGTPGDHTAGMADKLRRVESNAAEIVHLLGTMGDDYHGEEFFLGKLAQA